jgi:hypothetical protein
MAQHHLEKLVYERYICLEDLLLHLYEHFVRVAAFRTCVFSPEVLRHIHFLIYRFEQIDEEFLGVLLFFAQKLLVIGSYRFLKVSLTQLDARMGFHALEIPTYCRENRPFVFTFAVEGMDLVELFSEVCCSVEALKHGIHVADEPPLIW